MALKNSHFEACSLTFNLLTADTSLGQYTAAQHFTKRCVEGATSVKRGRPIREESANKNFIIDVNYYRDPTTLRPKLQTTYANLGLEGLP